MTTVEVGGRLVRLRGDPSGDILLIHGSGETSEVFAPLLRRLPGAFACDLPGHGGSGGEGMASVRDYAVWVTDLLKVLGARPRAVGGHSLGGAITLSLSLDGPYHPEALILIATGGRLRVHPDLLQGLRAGAFPEAFRQALLGPGTSVDLLKGMGEVPVEVTYGDFLACDTFDVLDRLGEIRSPAYVAVGEADRYTPEKYARTLARELGAKLEIFPRAGHMLPLEAPLDLARGILGFLRSLPPFAA